jgi:hypothetical protein
MRCHHCVEVLLEKHDSSGCQQDRVNLVTSTLKFQSKVHNSSSYHCIKTLPKTKLIKVTIWSCYKSIKILIKLDRSLTNWRAIVKCS